MTSRRTSEPRPPAAGARLGNYQLLSLLSGGGMGILYRARDTVLGREVALKRPHDHPPQDEAARERFLREARTASRLFHPGIVPVLAVLEHEGTLWLVMPFVEGEDLRERIQKKGPLAIGQALLVAEELASALAYAHARGVLHRDVKPANVLITSDGRALLTDFGLARSVAASGERSEAPTLSRPLTRPGNVVGTPGYMSPEQAMGKSADARSDVFSFGAVLYEMVTGARAFPNEVEEALDALLHRDPPPMSRYTSNVPSELERIARKALAKDPAERHQTAADLAADLRSLRRRFESGSTAASFPAWVRRRRRFTPLAAAILAALAAALPFLLRGRPMPGGDPYQVTTREGWEGDPAISPDGQLIAYVSDESGNPDVWLVDARGGKPIQLTDDPAVDRAPAWTPDGAGVLFVSERGGRPAVWKVPRLGGTATFVLADADEPAQSPDGRHLAFTRPGPGGDPRIWVVDLGDRAQARALTGDADGQWGHYGPAWSPDGTTIAYTDFHNLWKVPAAGGPALRVTSGSLANRDVTWSGDGRYLLFTSSRQRTRALWRMPAAGGAAARLTIGTGPESVPSVSRDGKRLALSTYAINRDIVLQDLVTGERVPIPGLRTEHSPALRSDGRAVVFCSDRFGDKFDLWLQPLERGRPHGVPQRLAEDPGDVSAPAWSADGRWVAYYSVIGEDRDVWVLPAEGGPAVRCTAHPAADIHPAWAPDGRRLAFASERSGRSRIWVDEFADGRCAGTPRQLTDGPAEEMFPAWSPDGGRLAWLDSVGTVWVTRLDSGGGACQIAGVSGAKRVIWESDRTLLVSHTIDGRLRLRRYDADTADHLPPEPSVDFGAGEASGGFDLAPDGRTLAFVGAVTSGDIWLIEATRGSF